MLRARKRHPVTMLTVVLGQRIQSLLDERDMSQAELARRVQLRQSTINGLVNGHSSGSKHLHRIARVLGTTAAYLEGETDDPGSDVPDSRFSTEEEAWIEDLRGLVPADRKAVLRLTHSLANSAAAPTIHAPKNEYRADGSRGGGS